MHNTVMPMGRERMSDESFFFLNDGQAGARARAVDWSRTSLGPPARWPATLKGLLATLFRSRQPLCLFWGPELVCFYNDALMPEADPKRDPMGMSLRGPHACEKARHIMGPQLETVLAEELSIRTLDDLVPIFRGVDSGEVYWTYDYSPVYDDTGHVAGVLVACAETTSHVLREQQLQVSEEKLRSSLREREKLCGKLRMKNEQLESAWQRLEAIFNNSPAAMAVLQGGEFLFEKLNPRYVALAGGRAAVGRKFFDVLPELLEGSMPEILANVFATGRPHELHESPLKILRSHGRLEEIYLDGTYVRLNDAEGRPYGIYAHLIDVTERVRARKKAEESQEQLTLALDSAQMGTWHMDLRTGNVVISKQLSEIMGRDIHEDLIVADPTMIHPQDLQEFHERWFEAINRRTVLSHEYRLVRESGEPRWVYSSGRAVYAANGEPLSISGVTLDITERKLAEERVRQSEARVRALAESMPQMAFVASATGETEYLNESFLSYLAMPAVGRGPISWLDPGLIHPDDFAAAADAWERCRSGDQSFQIEYRLRRHDGEYRWHLGRATPVFDGAGRLVQWYGTNTDIHDQKMHEAELRSAKEQAESASQSKSAFLANMSHEIRTPLGAILGFAELLRDSREEHERIEYAQIIDRNGKVLTKLIDDILDLSKVEAGRLELEKLGFDLGSLVREVVSLFEDRAHRLGIELQLTFEPDAPGVIISDPTRLRQILINLLGNALKFTPKGRVRLRVSSRSTDGVRRAAFEISDTGVGMNAEQAARLFAPFSQADSSTTRRFGGSGLGLALSRRLARALGGDVTLDRCAPGEGSVFTATIEAPAGASSAREERGELARQEFAAWIAARRAHVLLVEDSPDNQMLVSVLLRKAGMEVDIANNGAEGVEKAVSDAYDVILMDMQMPVLDGYAATELLRSRGYEKPIVALTAHAMWEEHQRILKAGCDAHLTKPLNSDLLLRTIQTLVPVH